MIEKTWRQQLDDTFAYDSEDIFKGFHWTYDFGTAEETDVVTPDEVEPHWPV